MSDPIDIVERLREALAADGDIPRTTSDMTQQQKVELAHRRASARLELETVCFNAAPVLLAEITRLRAEAANLRTVMVAAAEEIAAHWDAHCDAEGYGPTNLQRRLEEGIPSEYGYTAGAFAELKAERNRLRTALAAAQGAQWLPIESAPDGVSVLACNGLGYVGLAVKFQGHWQHIGKPTHWMPPLPAAPGASLQAPADTQAQGPNAADEGSAR